MPAPKHIEELLKNIPQKAGVYQYYDKSDKLLYIGKAKNLKKRVSSYFTKKQEQQIQSSIEKIQKIIDTIK